MENKKRSSKEYFKRTKRSGDKSIKTEMSDRISHRTFNSE